MVRRPDNTDVVTSATMDVDTVRTGNEDEMRDASSPLAPPTLEQFLVAIATRAFRFAEAGLRPRDDAQDAVPDTMIRMLIAAGPLRNGHHEINAGATCLPASARRCARSMARCARLTTPGAKRFASDGKR